MPTRHSILGSFMGERAGICPFRGTRPFAKRPTREIREAPVSNAIPAERPRHSLKAPKRSRRRPSCVFVGAGVSCPAGLPLFAGLVEQLFAKLHETPNAVQEAAIKAHQYDTAIMLLEEAVADGRSTVRKHLSDILTPKSDEDRDAAIPTHEALLTLAATREGRTHLVTTNFDRLFEAANSTRRPSVQTDAGPPMYRYRSPAGTVWCTCTVCSRRYRRRPTLIASFFPVGISAWHT